MKHRVAKWIRRAGQQFPDNCDWRYEANKLLPRIQEEVAELSEAVVMGNIKESLDAILDIQYFLDQYKLLLEKVGVDCETGADLVCDNNDDKLSTSKDYVETWLLEWTENDPWFAAKLRVEETWSVEDGCFYYCLKDDTGKVRKSKSHVAVDLLPCIPKDLLND